MAAALVAGLLVALVGGAPASPSDGVVVIVHPSNPTRTLDREQLRAIFSASLRFWPHGAPIAPFNAATGSLIRARFDEVVLGMSPREVGRFWVDQKVRGGPPPPRQAGVDAVAVNIVRRLEAAVAYVSAGTCLAGVRVVAVVEGGGVRAPTDEDRGEGACASER